MARLAALAGAALAVGVARAQGGEYGACLPGAAACNETFAIHGQPVTLPCSAAGSEVPSVARLPLLAIGDYALCGTFSAAHYCSVRLGGIDVPLSVHPAASSPAEVLHLGTMRLDLCVARACGPEQLRALWDAELRGRFADAVMQLVPPESPAGRAQMATTLDHAVSFSCVAPGERWAPLPPAGEWVLAFVYVSATLVLGCTLCDVYFKARSPRLVAWFSARRAAGTLVEDKGGDGALSFFDGMRVLSMLWIITGHTLASMRSKLYDPTAVQLFQLEYIFSFFKASEYAVDTFFFMSGFLAAHSLARRISRAGGLSPGLYLLLLVSRYARLAPLLVFMLLSYRYVLPFIGSGPMWQESITYDIKTCDKHMWTDVLMVNNWYSTDECAGWVWYIANDWQFFCATPLFVVLFLRGARAKSRVQTYGPLAAMLVGQVAYTAHVMLEYDIAFANPASGHKNQFFGRYVYRKPFARLAPYFIGAALALHFFQQGGYSAPRGSESRQRGLRSQGALLLQLAAIGALVAIFSAVYLESRCEDARDNCQGWGMVDSYGFLALQNWGVAATALFWSTHYIAYSVALAMLVYTMATRKDPIGLATLLGHVAWRVPARLTYGAYLFHETINAVLFALLPGPRYFCFTEACAACVSAAVYAYLVAFAVYCLVEAPWAAIYSAALSNVVGDPRRTVRTESATDTPDADSAAQTLPDAAAPADLARDTSATVPLLAAQAQR